VHDHAFGIDDEKAPQGHTGLFIQHVVGAGDLLLEVGHQGVLALTQAAIFAIALHPGQVAELAVNGNTEHFGVTAGEIAVTVRERRDLRGAHEGEIERIEKQHHIFAAVLAQGDSLEFLVHHGGGGEIRA
jgi:hypothetical protein